MDALAGDAEFSREVGIASGPVEIRAFLANAREGHFVVAICLWESAVVSPLIDRNRMDPEFLGQHSILFGPVDQLGRVAGESDIDGFDAAGEGFSKVQFHFCFFFVFGLRQWEQRGSPVCGFRNGFFMQSRQPMTAPMRRRLLRTEISPPQEQRQTQTGSEDLEVWVAMEDDEASVAFSGQVNCLFHLLFRLSRGG